jgi:hypothetical protein
MLCVKLKTFDEIRKISEPYQVLYQKTVEFVLVEKDSLNNQGSLTSSVFPGMIHHLCGTVITVVDKADYEFANDYCLYFKDTKIPISDWLLDKDFVITPYLSDNDNK